MPSILTGVRPIFTFADEGLIEYEKIAARRLGDIIERLELGEGANLQQEFSQFLPDDTARISFKVMEGILEPIIKVDIDRQDPEVSLRKEERQEDLQQPETRYYYSPSVWVGATTVNHTKTQIGDNVNCGFFGFPPQARIWAFEPEGINAGEGADGETYGYTHTVESYPGLTEICGLPSWLFGKEEQPGASVNRKLTILNNTQYDRGSNLSTEGFFGDQNWRLLEAIVRSQSGMTAFEGPGCYATTPPDALWAWGQNGTVGAFVDEEGALPENYWFRSVIVAPSYTFAESDPNDNSGVAEKSYVIPAIVEGESPAGEANGVITTTEMPTGPIFNQVLPGSYEFNIMAEAFVCECANSEVRVRLVLGERVREIEELNGETSNVTYQAIVEVHDFSPEEIGDAFTCQGILCRDESLGGHGICEEEGERGSLDSNGRGIWQSAIYVNPLAGTWELNEPSYQAPFFDSGPSVCPQGTPQPDDPGCLSCSFAEFVPQSGFGFANGGHDCIHSNFGGNASVANSRQGVGFHLARVVGVEAPSNRICHVQLVGNDGGAGTCGSLPSYSYGSVFFATGIDPGIPLGTDLANSGLPTLDGGPFGTPGEIGGWAVGQLVVVVGVAGTCVAGSCGGGGSARLLVSTLNAGGENFRLEYWSQFRCSNGIAFQNFVEIIEEQSTISTPCADGYPATPALTYQDLGGFGGFAS